MRNTLTIQSSGSCMCICLDSVYDGTNSIYLSLDVKNVTNPKLQIYKDGVLKSTVTLKANQENVVIIPEDLYAANAVITFKYSDDDYTGNTFTINFPAVLEGNMLIKKASEYIYTANYTKIISGQQTTVNVKVNSTTTGEPGTDAEVTNVGDDVNVKLDFVIPRGDKGEKGDRGDSGVTVPASGMFTLSGDEDGNLWAYYTGDAAPEFDVDEDGNIYYITPDE